VNIPRSDEDRLKLMELMVFLLQRNVCVEIGINAFRLSKILLSGKLSPHIYISCIKQFWNSVSVKRSGDVTRLQALVDKKKIVISEAVIREILQLNDAEGVVCLPNEEIFAGLAQIGVGKGFSGVETPLFEGMIADRQPAEEELGAEQVQVDVAVAAAAVVEDVAEDVLDTCSALARKVEGLENDKAAQQLEIVKLKARVKKLEKINMVKSSKLRRLKKVGTSQRVESSDDMENVFNQGRIIVDMDQDEGIELVADQEKDAEKDAKVEGRHADKQAELYNLDQDHSSKVLSMQEDDTEVEEAVEIVTTAKLMTEVVTAAATQVVAANCLKNCLKDHSSKVLTMQKMTQSAASTTIPAARSTIPAAKLTIFVAAPTVDKGKGIMVEAPKPIKKKDQIEMDAKYARKLQEEIDRDQDRFNKDVDWDAAMDHVLSMQEDDTEVQKAVEIVTTAKLMIEVVTDAATQVVAASTPIPAAKPKILNIAAAAAISTRRRKGVEIRDPEEELPSDTSAETPKVKDKGKGILIKAPKPMNKKDQIEMDAEYARKLQEEINKEHEETYKNIDWNATLDHVQSKEPQYIKRYHGMKKKPQTESKAPKNMIFDLKNTEGYKMDFFKGMKYDEILPIFQAKFDANMRFLFKSREEMEEEDKEIIKSINETPAQKATKRRKLSEEAQEAEDLRKRLEIVQDEDDDTMFKEPDGKDAIWRNQKSVHGLALVKRWKLLTLCGVHVITLSTVQLFLLVETRYPLSRFTLEQLVNVARLQVEEESEMSLELLKFTRQQLQEYQLG
nr:hypothetical protein [Tanacetum cinerariifolium]